MQRLIWPFIAFTLTAAVLAAGVWWWAYGAALDRLSSRGQTELSLAADRLQSHLQRFRQLSVVLSDHPSLIALLREDSDQFVVAAEELLLAAADKTGSTEVFVLSGDGIKVASSLPGSDIGKLGGTRYFHRAMHGALGTAHLREGDGPARMFYAAAPIQIRGQPPIGVVVVKVDVEAVETDWRASPNILFFTDREGLVFVANRVELLFHRLSELKLADLKAPAKGTAEIGFRQSKVSAHDLWSAAQGRRYPATSLHLVKPSPVIDLDGHILLDATRANTTALWQAAFAATASLVLAAIFLILMQRRLALAERLQIEEEATRQLEARVARRTEQLSGVNLDLRQQIKERRDAEQALRRAQQDLVQAGKLSALGQMSAGISHELNQPLMAIRSFAENAETFLARGDIATASGNLARISDLARRMGRIIKNLRAFARKEGEPMTDVDLTEVILAAIELSENQLQQAGVAVAFARPDHNVMVRGGEVRLQQVAINLLSNAADAMEGHSDKRVDITISETPDMTRLIVRDTGPGLDDAERIFDPFYSTKEVGKSEGMGLGLSISYGIVQSFGGQITGRNHPEGGAEFSVDLTPVRQEAAA